MISFLIPIYNRDVNALVDKLFEQCESSGKEFEILLYDDFSTSEFRAINSDLSHKMGVSYMEMSKNLGRSKIRNWLGKNARFEWLVFMDCDSIIEQADFVANYISAISSADLVYGGTSYQRKRPDKNKTLHWEYGRKIEAESIGRRRKLGFKSFRSNNFMIRRAVFIKNLFDEKVDGYGYEDIFLAESLEDKGCTICHIENPLLHDGLELNSVFLEKTDHALKNLFHQFKNGKVKTRLTEKHSQFKDNGILNLFRLYTKVFAKNRRMKLLTAKPSMLRFQLYKLELWDRMMQSKLKL